MGLPPSLLLLLLLLLPPASSVSPDTGSTSGRALQEQLQEEQQQEEEVDQAAAMAYLVYYEDGACSLFAGAKGFVSGAPQEVVVAAGTGKSPTCQSSMPCLLDITSMECISLDLTDVLSVEVDIRKDDFVHSTNSTVVKDDKLILDSECLPSGSFTNCYYRFVNINDIANDPRTLLLQPPSDDDKEEVLAVSRESGAPVPMVYLVYYSQATDAKCSEVAGMRGIIPGHSTELLGARGPTGSCKEAMPCLIDPVSVACASLELTSIAYVDIELGQGSDEINVLSHSGMTVHEETDCLTSTVYDGCDYRFVKVEQLFSNITSLTL
jgi:hypothetical protein